MATEAQKRAKDKYDRETSFAVNLKLNKKTDNDIITFLTGCDNRQGTIKKILREYLESVR